MKEKIIKNIPNLITFSRIIACVAGAAAFVWGNIPFAVGLYVYGAVSDYFDGLAATKLNASSEFGRKLDAFSDKIYAGSLLIPSILCGNLLMLIPLALELKISGITIKSEKLGFNPATLRVGKFKTAALFPTMIVALLSTKFIGMTPLLWTLLPLTTILQSKSITAYENLFNYNMSLENIKTEETVNEGLVENTYKDNEHKEVKEETEKKNISNRYRYGKPKDLVKELAFYVTTPDFKIDYNNKNVKRKRRLK